MDIDICRAVSIFTHTHTRVCVCSVIQSCPTLCDPLDCSPPGSSVLGISQARILEWLAISFSRGSSQLRDQIRVFCIFCIAGDTLPLSHRGSPIYTHTHTHTHTQLYTDFNLRCTFIHPHFLIHYLLVYSTLYLDLSSSSEEWKEFINSPLPYSLSLIFYKNMHNANSCQKPYLL